jgi:hypothetical protein
MFLKSPISYSALNSTNRNMKRYIYLSIFLLAVCGCKKPYTPTAISNTPKYLVVEGVINAGFDSTYIKLSRTVSLSADSSVNNPERNAIVIIQSNANDSYPLTEIIPGTYAVPGLNLDITKKYKVSITTSDNKQYVSDLVSVNVTPPIDSVGFTIQANNLQLYVNTHDPKNSTRYYRWDYMETWQFHSKYDSEYITNGSAIVPRTTDQYIFNCFGNYVSSTIVLGSSAKLAQDVIYQNPLLNIASTSLKLQTKYSVLVHEYALTPDAYTFWTNLKKNTEQLGSIFDAQPSNVNGNIHSVADASLPVVGYISACTVQTKRIFISNLQLPQSWQPVYPYNCSLDSDWFDRPNSHPPENMVLENLVPLGSGSIPVTPFYQKGSPSPVGYLAADIQCVDCTLMGTTVRPSFWQ